ncbi:hypothetical protein [Uliginosibacterium sp. H1]|uniref:hypothetical protein n=1 Tax=Uliginosibacterium sp. H1 TaxID=3114757 RepID=UPI002E17CF7F|nr:hypothetical protein [Uliginosibacterium sp. H1]
MTDTTHPAGQLGRLDIDALFVAARLPQGEACDSQDASGRSNGPAWPSPNPLRPDMRASHKPSNHEGLRDAGPLGPSGPPENEGIEHATSQRAPGSGYAEGEFRAAEKSANLSRPTLHYRLKGEAGGSGGTVIGKPSDSLADLLTELQQRYGSRLDVESVHEAFDERAGIMQFEAGLGVVEAEQKAAEDILSRWEPGV